MNKHMRRTNPIVEFLATLPQFAMLRMDGQVIHLNSGCVVDSLMPMDRTDAHMFTLRLRWPGSTGYVEHLVEANRYVELQLLEAGRLGVDISGFRDAADLAFTKTAVAWIKATSC